MSATVKAERFNTRGARIEDVEVTANRVGEAVYLHVKGQGPPKSFVMAASAWEALDGAARDTGNVTPMDRARMGVQQRRAANARDLAERLRTAANKMQYEPIMDLLDEAAAMAERGTP